MKRQGSYRIAMVWLGVAASISAGGADAVKADFIWARKADMPINKMQTSISVVGGKIYSIGGWSTIGEWNPQWEAITRVDKYDPTTDTWTRKADMPTGRGHTNACVVDEKIYVIGGDAGPGTGYIQAVEVYDPITDTWTRKADMPTKRYWFSTCVVDGIIYVIGGTDGHHTGMVEAYDPVSDTWTQRADRPTPSSFLTTCAVDGLIYAIGGGAPGTSAVEVYDPATDTWTTKAAMPTARYGLDAVLVEGKLYAIGGWWHSANGPIYSTVEVYDLVTDTWTSGAAIPVTTAMHSASIIDGKIYIFGGVTAPHKGEHWILTSAVYANERIVDFNGDGKVDGFEFSKVVDHWGENEPSCDIGPTPLGDGVVDVNDLIVLAEYIGKDINDPTLVAHWALDETEGAIAQDTGGTYDGAVIGTPVWHPDAGNIDGALELDGSTFVTMDHVVSPADGPFSVLAWIKGGAPGQVIISQGAGTNWLMLDPVTGTLMTELKSPGRSAKVLYSDTMIDDSRWHRVGFGWDGSNRRLYVDDTLVAEDTQPGLAACSGGLHIGAGKGLEPSTFWKGLIDDVRIYNRVVKP